MRPASFAPVAPIQILEEMSPTVFRDYHLFLAHHTVEFAERFTRLMNKHADNRPYPNKINVIMDNSIVELGGAVDDLMIYDACKAVQVQGPYNVPIRVVPCLPDVMGSAEGTMELTAPAYQRWEVLGMDTISNCGYMLVTQGETKEEFVDLVNYFFVTHKEAYRNISWVGIPRYMCKQWAISRKWAIRYIQMVAPHVKIHLLGFTDDVMGDMFDAREPGVQGIDSAVPVRYNESLLTTTTEAEIGKRGDWMETGRLTATNIDNILRVRHWINNQTCLQQSQ